MYLIEKTKRIDASHQLTKHDGKCATLHGHTWTITVGVKGMELSKPKTPKRGMLFDYYDMGLIMKKHVVDLMDHKHLNDVFDYPTSELIAQELYMRMVGLVEGQSDGRARLAFIKVSETPDSVATYTP